MNKWLLVFAMALAIGMMSGEALAKKGKGGGGGHGGGGGGGGGGGIAANAIPTKPAAPAQVAPAGGNFQGVGAMTAPGGKPGISFHHDLAPYIGADGNVIPGGIQPKSVGGTVTFLGKSSPEVLKWQEEMEKARKAVVELGNRRIEEFCHTPEFIACKESLTRAQADVDAAELEVLTALKENSQYRDAVDERRPLLKKQAAMEGNATYLEKHDLLVKIAELDTVINRMEADALKSSPKVQQARTARSQAQAAMIAMGNQFTQSLHADPQWAAANGKLEATKQKLVEANARANPTFRVNPVGSGK